MLERSPNLDPDITGGELSITNPIEADDVVQETGGQHWAEGAHENNFNLYRTGEDGKEKWVGYVKSEGSGVSSVWERNQQGWQQVAQCETEIAKDALISHLNAIVDL